MAEWSCNGLQIRLRRFDSDSGLHIKPCASGVFCCPLSPASPPPPAAARIGSPRIPVTGGGPLPAMRCPAFHPGSVSAAPGPVADTGSGEKPGDPTQAPAGKGQDATGGGGGWARGHGHVRGRPPASACRQAWTVLPGRRTHRRRCRGHRRVRSARRRCRRLPSAAWPGPRLETAGASATREAVEAAAAESCAGASGIPPPQRCTGREGAGGERCRVCAGRGKASAARPGGFMRFPGGRPRAGSASSAVLSTPGLYP